MPSTNPTSPESQPSQPESSVQPEQFIREEFICDFGYLGLAQRELRRVEMGTVTEISARQEEVAQAERRLERLVKSIPPREIVFMEPGLYHLCVDGGPNSRRPTVARRNIAGLPWLMLFGERTQNNPHEVELRHYSGEKVKYRIVEGTQALIIEQDWRLFTRPQHR